MGAVVRCIDDTGAVFVENTVKPDMVRDVIRGGDLGNEPRIAEHQR
jgi:hypothetical protein